MTQPITTTPSDTTAPPVNLYADLIAERFSLPVPLLRKTKEKDENLYAPCVVLSASEIRVCEKNAYAETLADFNGKAPKKDEDLSAWNKIYDNNRACWIIYSAIRVPGNLNAKLYPAKQEVMSVYSEEELGIMYSNYCTVLLNQRNLIHFDDNNPNALSQMMDQIIKFNTEEQTAFFLNSLTTRSLSMFVKSLIEEVKNLQLSTGSSGALSDDTTQNEPIQNNETNG
jgi:hypothetical protein